MSTHEPTTCTATLGMRKLYATLTVAEAENEGWCLAEDDHNVHGGSIDEHLPDRRDAFADLAPANLVPAFEAGYREGWKDAEASTREEA